MADALTVPCPDCLSGEDVPCRSSYGDVTHAERQRIADLRALEQGTCALCGALLVRGSVDGSPVAVWHPYPADQVCPPLPDPRTDWNGYALALQQGAQPGHPGAQHFLPQATLDHVQAMDLNEVTTGVSAVMCPECANGKCQNCISQALHPVTDELTPCTCPNCGGVS